MNVSRTLGASFVALASALVACSSGGGNVTPNNSLNPTTAPSGATATPSASSGTTTSATATATAAATVTPSSAASATPTSSQATASAAPTATASAASTSCTTSSASPSSMAYTLPGTAETIDIPTYNVFSGTSNLPSQSPSGSVLTIKDSQNNFDNISSSVYDNRTTDFFASLSVSESTTFGDGSDTLLIPVTLNSACITSGTTYTVNEYDSTLSTELYSETDTGTSGSVTGHIEVSVNPFPSGETVDIIVSH